MQIVYNFEMGRDKKKIFWPFSVIMIVHSAGGSLYYAKLW